MSIASGHTAEQLEPVRDAGVRGEAGPQRRHRVEGLEGRGVAAELDERVAGDAVVERRRRRDRVGLAAEHERVGETVARERERAEAARRDEVVWREAERARQDLLRLRVVGRVTGLASPLLVGEPEQAERLDVAPGSSASVAWSFATMASVLPPAEKPACELRPRATAARAAGLGVAADSSWKTPPSESATAVRLPPLLRVSVASVSRCLLDPGWEGPAGAPPTALLVRPTGPGSPGAATPRRGTCSMNGQSFASTPSPSRLFGLLFGSPNAPLRNVP